MILKFWVFGRRRWTEKGKEDDILSRNSLLLRINKTEMEKEYCICRGKIYFFRGEQNREIKLRNKFSDWKYVFLGRRLIVEEKEENIWRTKIKFLRIWSFLRSQLIQKIIRKSPVDQNDHLQEAARSQWSFARSCSILMIICETLIYPDNHLQEAGCFGWSFVRGRSIRIIICSLSFLVVCGCLSFVIVCCLLLFNVSHCLSFVASCCWLFVIVCCLSFVIVWCLSLFVVCGLWLDVVCHCLLFVIFRC